MKTTQSQFNMLATLIIRLLKDRKVALISYIVSGVLLAELYIALFPEIKDQADQFTKLLETYPDAFKKAFGLGELVLNNLEDYMAMEQFNFVWPLMMVFMVVSFIGRGLVGEIERGTVELTLARPISRLTFYTSRVVGALVALMLFIALNILGIFAFAALHGIDFRADHYVSIGIVGMLFGAAIVGITALFSALFSERSKVYGAVGGILVAMYVANIVAALNDSLVNIKYLSFFHYYNPALVLGKNIIETQTVLVFAAVAIVGIVAGAMRFMRRDISVA